MKTKKYLSLAALALLIAGCANEEADNGKKTDDTTDKLTFIGSMISEPVKAESATRTSLDGIFPGTPGLNNVTFYWEVGDEIWFDNNQHAPADITAKNPNAKFDFTTKGGIGGNERMVYYPGKNATTYNQVTIPTVQTQTAANNTEKLGENGDCGVAKATKVAYRKYKFTLKHKASYLCLLPRSANNFTSDVKVISVKVTSDNNIAGTYTLPNTETGALTGSGSSKEITVNATGAELSTATTDQSKNAIYVVIAPGTHKLTLEYTIEDSKTNVKGTIKKAIVQKDYKENTVYPLTANLTVLDYSSSFTQYYMWDAAEGEYFWKGYENEQPSTVWDSNNGNYPKNNSDPRWYNEDLSGYHNYNDNIDPAVKATRSCKDCPNINEVLWYIHRDYGDPHWDDINIWAMKGHLYKHGMWFKKKAAIGSSFSSEKAPDGRDYRRTRDLCHYNIVPPRLSTSPLANPSDYFFLPSLGRYWNDDGKLVNLGVCGSYWISTPYWGTTYPDPKFVYELELTNYQLSMYGAGPRYYGCRIWKLDGVDYPQP